MIFYESCRGSPADKGQGDFNTNAMEALEGFVIGLYSAVFNAIVSLINRFVCQHAYCQKAHLLSLSLKN